MSSSAANLTSSHNDDPLDEPPPYTPRADPLQGESTVEYGPRRPFQQSHAVPPPAPVPEPIQRPTSLSSQSTGVSRRGRSLWQQLTDQIDQFAEELERRGANSSRRANPAPQRANTSWSSYPGRPSTNVPTLPPRRNVPPLPPRRRAGSTSSLPETQSEFARDFYAAGSGNGLFPDIEGNPASSAENRATRSPQTNPSLQDPPPREDRSPTTTPTPGRPLLRDGKLLVYPRGHTCEKCSNTGYKHFDPDQPCKKCWNKYAKPFSGPLAYSYSSSTTLSNTQSTNLQKPLPARPNHFNHPTPRFQPPIARPVTYNGWHAVSQDGMHGRGPYITSGSRVGPPPPGTVVYQPGDPRIGGNLCWRCNGKGTMNIIIDVVNCPVCDGCGRTFGSMY